MKRTGNPPSAPLQVSASELAQMGVCERLVVFENRYGKRRTVLQQRAIQRGLRAHLRFYHRHFDASADGRTAITTRIASVVYGWLRRAAGSPLWPLRWCIARRTKAVGRSDGNWRG